MMRPLRQLRVLESRLDTVEFLMRPRCAGAVAELRGGLKGLRDVSRILTHMQSARANANDWLQLVQHKRVSRGRTFWLRSDAMSAGLVELETLGEGRFSTVLLVRGKDTPVKRVLKVMAKNDVKRLSARQPTLANEVRMEAEVLGRLKHHNVVNLVDHSEDDSCYLRLFEYHEGARDVLRVMQDKGNDEAGALSEDVARHVVAQVVNALEYIHSNGVIHRDLKPENIVLANSGLVQLIDFGTCVDQHNAHLPVAKFAGTPQFMAPESLKCQPATPAVDLWALGCVVFKLLTGVHAFEGETEFLTMMKVEAGEVTIPESLSPPARDLIAKLLVAEPSQRLGMGAGGYDELRAHSFFRGVDFATTVECLQLVKGLCDQLCALRDPVPNENARLSLNEVAASVGEEVGQLARVVQRVVNVDQTRQSKRFVVAEGVSCELDSLKERYDGLEEVLTDAAALVMQDLPTDLSDLPLNCVYFPQLGYLIAVPVLGLGKEEWEQRLGPSFEAQFETAEKVYLKNDLMREYDECLGDLYAQIVDFENSVCRELEEHVMAHQAALLKAVAYCANLDCLISLAVVALENNYCRPELENSREIDIVEGRHPLQELCVESFIPNSSSIGREGQSFVHIVTGPNCSGKSVYLKQVGAIVYLAQVGSFVPAKSARVGIADAILTRINSRETSLVGHSTFMLDLGQIAGVVRRATGNSLVIVDEFGKGTAGDDGVAMLAAVIHHLSANEHTCPRSLFSTHFSEVYTLGLVPPSAVVEYFKMDVLAPHAQREPSLNRPPHDLVFLFKLSQGIPSQSYGIACARVAGVPEDVLARAQAILDCMKGGGAVPLGPGETHFRAAERVVRNLAQLDVDDAMAVQQFLETVKARQ